VSVLERPTGGLVDIDGARYGPYLQVDLKWEGSLSEAGTCFRFERLGSAWVHVAGFEYGPFDEAGVPTFLDETGDVSWFTFARDRGRYACVHDEEYGPYQSVSSPTWSADGRVVAFSIRRGNRGYLVHEDEEKGPFPSKRILAVLDSSGEHLALAYDSRGKKRVELDGELLGSFEYINLVPSCFSQDGESLAFGSHKREGKHHLAHFWVDGRLEGPFGDADGPWWSPEGHLVWAYASTDWSKEALVIDGEVHELQAPMEWERGSAFGFAPDGRFVCVLRGFPDGDQLLIGEETHGPFFLQQPSHSDKIILFDEAGRYAFAYRPLRSPSWYVHFDGEEFGPYGAVDFALSPKGTLSIAHLDEKRSRVVLLTGSKKKTKAKSRRRR
jgi:hypothetical protein